MTAKEMFEKLDFIYENIGDNSFTFNKYYVNKKGNGYGQIDSISFNLDTKKYFPFSVSKEYKDLSKPLEITGDIHNAIDLQLKELGWIK